MGISPPGASWEEDLGFRCEAFSCSTPPHMQREQSVHIPKTSTGAESKTKLRTKDEKTTH